MLASEGCLRKCDIVISICNRCCAEGFASADATRGQWKQTNVCGRPLTPSQSPPMLLGFYRYKGDKKENNGSSRNLGGRAAWGRVCGRAKLLAGTLRCLRLCWRLPWDWSDEEQLGRCPKPQQGRCPCTLQGTASLDPFSRLSWSRFHAPSACSFLVLRLSPCLLPQLSVKNIILPVTPLLPHPPQHTPPPHPCSHSPAVLSGTSTAHDDPAPDYTPIESAVRRNPPAPSA